MKQFGWQVVGCSMRRNWIRSGTRNRWRSRRSGVMRDTVQTCGEQPDTKGEEE